jgi:hypothetical protein
MWRTLAFAAATICGVHLVSPASALDVIDNGGPRGKLIGAGNGIQVDPATGHLLTIQRAPPTLTSCTSGAVVAGSTDSAGQISSLGSTTTCTVVFGSPFVTAPFCVATDITGAAAVQVAPTAAHVVVTVTSAHNFAWFCIGQNGG